MLTDPILIEQNRQLRAERDELREEVRQLRKQLFADDPLPACLPHLTPNEESALRVLLRRRGLVTKEAIYNALYGHRDGPDEKLVDVWVHKLRRKLEGTGYEIITSWGRGYELVRPPEPLAA